MGNDKINESENIFVSVDQQNIIHIDPNSVVDNNGQIQPRSDNTEDMVMYLNLRADLIPRIKSKVNSTTNRIVNIAEGNFNILRNQNDNNPFENNLDTDWTETFVSNDFIGKSRTNGSDVSYDPTTQSFGVQSVTIIVKGANNIPQVSMNFVDIRGKTLFESPSNSPYEAFFHYPWPIFYLTVKGYYGKAIQYKLHLVDIKTKFNSSTGNFEISTKFVGATYAHLSELSFQNAINAPFLYMVESENEPYSLNTKTGLIDKKISKSTKGLSVLKSVYDGYKSKGYIPKDFPVKTLRDLLMTSKSIDKIIENELFSQTVDPKVLTDVVEYDEDLIEFEKRIIGWGTRYLNPNIPELTSETLLGPDGKDKVYKYFKLNKQIKEETKSPSGLFASTIILSTEEKLSLVTLIQEYVNKLESNLAFGKNIANNKSVKTTYVSTTPVKNIEKFYRKINGEFGVAIEKLVDAIKEIQTDFIKKRNQVEKQIEDAMNVIISNGTSGFGFKPTIRNIFAVILANADTYIRLMSDVHDKIVDNNLVRPLTNGSNKNENTYPWPEVLENNSDGGKTLFYPADSKIINKTKGNDFSLWPEVEFVENYISIASKRVDPLTKNEINTNELNFIFEDFENNINKISTFLSLNNDIPYTDNTIINFLYEMYDRALHIVSYDNVASIINGITDLELENIDNSINNTTVKKLFGTEIKNTSDFINNINTLTKSQFYNSKTPNIDYIKTLVSSDFSITKYELEKNENKDSSKLNDYFKTFNIQPYRLNSYPFNSDFYFNQNGVRITKSDFKFDGILNFNNNGNFISSPINTASWIESKYVQNIFSKKIEFNLNDKTYYENLLNTPYFHQQLFSDFTKSVVSERYVGSAYLLLHSLPLLDLNDDITFNGKSIKMVALLKEIGATHYIPQLTLLKWGAQYHRYKKFLKENVDILVDFNEPINGSIMYDNGTNTTFNLPGLSGLTYNSGKTIGLHPYYYAIYHQIINGYSFYNPSGFDDNNGTTNNISNDFTSSITNNVAKIITNKSKSGNRYSLTTYVDNNRFNSQEFRVTLLPSGRITAIPDITTQNFNNLEQDSFKIIYDESSYNNISYSDFTLPKYDETFSDIISLENNNKKFLELITIFSPKILDELENMFIEFSSLDLKLETSNNLTFQKLLRRISSLDDVNFNKLDNKTIIENQKQNHQLLTNLLLNDGFLYKFTISNPKQIDNYLLYGISNLSPNFNIQPFSETDVNIINSKLVELYIGHNVTDNVFSNITNNIYIHFFRVNNIKLNEENIKDYRELARIFSGWAKSNIGSLTKTNFINYIKSEIIEKQQKDLNNYFDILIPKIIKLNNNSTPKKQNSLSLYNGYNESETIKLDLYLYFKDFNDKWIAGDSIGQRYLMDDFLFLDRANRDIGDTSYISLERLISLADENNIKVNLYSALSILLQGTNFDMRALPAYINFYGDRTKKIEPSKNIANMLFGKFLDVDYQSSNPKMIIQYINGVSKYLNMDKVNTPYKFKNDSMDIRQTTNNSLLVEPKLFMDTDFRKSNRVVSFEVNFGDFGQGIFIDVSLDQSTYKNTTESHLALERLARSQGGGGTYQVDTGLFDIYKTASYQCTVKMMGNVMIQPTMYFYLANIPMFEGTYLVYDVTHQISSNKIETTITGVRLSNTTLPNLETSFIASYRPLFSRVLSSAIKKKRFIDNSVTLNKTIKLPNNQSFVVKPGLELSSENLDNIIKNEKGLHKNLIPYNGQNNEDQILLIQPKVGEQWLRTRVVRMGSSDYLINNNTRMELISGLSESPSSIIKWVDISNKLTEYYSTRVVVTPQNKNTIKTFKTEFFNPQANIKYTLSNNYDFNNKLFTGIVHNGPQLTTNEIGYGIGMSYNLMKKLKINEGDIIYFRLI